MFKNILLTLLFLGGICIGYILKEAGVFRIISPHFTGNEYVKVAPPGIEDITADHNKGIAYMSSHDRRNFESEGSILYQNLTSDNSDPKEMVLVGLNFEFRPHGISLLQSENGSYLFVVNHERDLNSILRFKVKKDSLIFEKRFIHDLIQFPNDVLAISSDAFYITNDHTIPRGLRRTLGDFMLEKSGNVVFYTKNAAKVVSQPIAYANGINISNDGVYLFVASTTENKLYVYKHNLSLEKREILDSKVLNSAPDNIEIDIFGNLWIAAHPQLLKYLGHANDENSKSPSQVLKVVYLPNEPYRFLQEEIYLNDGAALSGSSVASYFHTDSSNTILVGSVFESKTLQLHRAL